MKWREVGASINSHSTITERAFLELFDSLGLQQWISVPTYPSSGNALDLVLTTEPDCIASVSVEAPLPVCDHCPVIFVYVYTYSYLSSSANLSENSASPDLRRLFRRRLSAEGAKPESNNRWKSELGHVCMYVWYLELSREPRHVTQQMMYQNVGLRNGHCLGTVSSGCDFQRARGARKCQNK